MELTSEQKDIVRAAREFAEAEFTDRAKEFDEKEEFDPAIWKRAALQVVQTYQLLDRASFSSYFSNRHLFGKKELL